MKPTPEQVDDWELKAAQYAESQTSEYYEFQQAKNEKFAELAAQWGEQQSQDGKRYRAIRDGLEVDPHNSGIVVSLVDDFGGETLRGEQADAAIDAAMKGQQP